MGWGDCTKERNKVRDESLTVVTAPIVVGDEDCSRSYPLRHEMFPITIMESKNFLHFLFEENSTRSFHEVKHKGKRRIKLKKYPFTVCLFSLLIFL